MNGLLVFNSANDVVYFKFNDALHAHMRKKAMYGKLLPADSSTVNVDPNIILQMFSPMINSQRMMLCQFDNPYSSFVCEFNLTFSFADHLGCTFVKIAQRPQDILKRHLGVAIALARNLYGANLFSSRASAVQDDLYTACIDCYEEYLWVEEQTMLIEAMPRLLINTELKRTVRSTLDAALDHLRDDLGLQRCHALMFVSHKFTGISSSKQALTLCPADILFISLLIRSLQRLEQKQLNRSVAIFLQGVSQDPHSGCLPCIAHISELDRSVMLVQVIEYANLNVASAMYDTFFVLQKIITVQLQGDSDALKPAYDNLETYAKQTLDAMKRAKLKGDELELTLKKFAAKWENLKKLYVDFFKCLDRESMVRIESNIPPFREELKQLFTLACCDSSSIPLDQLPDVATIVEGKLLEFVEFLVVKAERNVSIEAYLEDFPGLIHFAYVNRSIGLMIAPELPDRANLLANKNRLWNMVEFARGYLKKGISTVLWKDKKFHYSYFLWFEDQGNGTLKAIDLQQHFVTAGNGSNAFKPQFEPGLLAEDYYEQLTETCFPKSPPGKVKCYELFCIHLGLVTPTCAVEHARRLVHSIVDVVGEDTF